MKKLKLKCLFYATAIIFAVANISIVNAQTGGGPDCTTASGTSALLMLPFSAPAESTLGMTDDYNNSNIVNTCTANAGLFTSGQDKIYAFTPIESGSIILTLTALESDSSGLFIYLDCPSNGTCLASNTGISGVKNLGITVNAGSTYYVMVDRKIDANNVDYILNYSLNISAPDPYCPKFTTGTGNSIKNLDFELGNLTNWTGQTGMCCPVNTPTNGNVTGRHTVTRGNGIDPFGNIPVVAPGGGKYSARLGNSDVNAQAERLRYQFKVTSTSAVLLYKYAVVLQDGGHDASEQPRFEIQILDGQNQPIKCGTYKVAINANAPCFEASPTSSEVFYRQWTTVGVDLTKYIGQKVTVDYSTGDCSASGHFGYAYLDVSATKLQIQVVGANACQGTGKVKLTAPEGFGHYAWSGPGVTAADTFQVLEVTANLGDRYDVELASVSDKTCLTPLSVTINTSSITANFSTTKVCEGDTTTFTDLSKVSGQGVTVGALKWDFGDGEISDDIEEVKHIYANAGTYTVKLVASSNLGCKDSITKTVVVEAPPTTTFNMPSSVCLNETVDIAYTGNAISTAAFTWNFNGGTVLSGTGKGPYKVRWSTAGTKNVSIQVKQNTCTITNTKPIVVYSKIILNPSSVKTTGCGANDGSATANAGGGAGSYTYVWNTTPVQTTATATGLGSGNYTVTVTDAAGCTGSAVVPVSDGSTTLAATVDNVINPTCDSTNNGSARANVTGGNLPYSYLWSDGQITQTASNLAAGDISVSVTDASGCVVSASATLTTPNALVVIAGADTTACPGGTVNLNASVSGGNGTLSYAWTSIPAGYNANTQSATDNPITNTTYIITVSDSKSCSMSDTLNVIISIPTADFDLPKSICLNAPVQATYTGTANSSATYNWNFDGATVISGTNAGPYELSWNTNGTKNVSLTVIENGCSSIPVTHSIEVSNQATATFSLAKNKICIDATNTVTYTGPIFNDAIYTWDFNGATVISGTGKGPYELKWPTDGNKTISLSVSSQVCALLPFNQSLDVESIIASFTSNPGIPAVLSLVGSTKVDFTNQSTSNANTFDWDFGDGTTHSTDANPSHTYTKVGTYSVSLAATSTTGCTNSITKGTIEILDFNTYLYVPNVFIPVQNKGKFVITYAGIASAKLNIFNRWGQLVYETDNLENFWDGFYKNQIVEEGVYVYILTAKGQNGKTFDLNGTVVVKK